MPLQLSEQVRALAAQAEGALKEQFARIDGIAEHNTQRVLAAFRDHRVAEGYFAGTTGYGYDDLGRDQLDRIYAQLFGTEDALVRIGFVNGTHAIAAALYGALLPGDVLLSAVGAPLRHPAGGDRCHGQGEGLPEGLRHRVSPGGADA